MSSRSVHHDELVSVIIPTYNCAHFIGEAIESVLGQDYPAIEIVIVDDGSTDDTKVMVERFPGPIRYFFQANQGPAVARNFAISEARGAYVALLDADDVWLPGKLRRQLAYVREHPECGLVYTDLQLMDRDGRVVADSIFRRISYEPSRDGSGWVFEKLLLNNFIYPSTVLLRKDVLDEVGPFEPGRVPAETTDLFLRLARRHQVGCVDEPLAQRRRHDGALTSDFEQAALPVRIALLESYARRGALDPITRLRLRLLLAGLLRRLGRYELGRQRRRRALYSLYRSARYWPLNPAVGFAFFTVFPHSWLGMMKWLKDRAR